MARIRLFHWNADEAKEFLHALRAAGHQVAYDTQIAPGLAARIRKSPPEAFVIALTRLPVRGRDIAAFLRGLKSTRHIPIVFVDGSPEKVDTIRRQIPDAVYTTLERLAAALQQALAHPSVAPVVPPQMMERYRGRTAAQKLGITPGAKVRLLDPPRDYASMLGPLPDGVTFLESPGINCSVTMWFVTDAGLFQARLASIRTLAATTRLWILWPKGRPQSGLTHQYLRKTAHSLGLVDYKICSVNARWSAMAFARRKA